MQSNEKGKKNFYIFTIFLRPGRQIPREERILPGKIVFSVWRKSRKSVPAKRKTGGAASGPPVCFSVLY